MTDGNSHALVFHSLFTSVYFLRPSPLYIIMNVPPYVNGVSPCEGQPGTKIKIWGENLGLSESDVVSIKICGHECIDSMDWVSDRKIICESGEGIGRGRIIVNTLSGGIGSCSVYFTGLEKLSPGSPSKKKIVFLTCLQ